MSRRGEPAHPPSVRRLTSLLLVLWSLPASAQTAVAHQRVVALANPIGAEHMLAVGMRGGLGLPDEILFGDTHVELGAVSYTSPIYQRTGAYLQLQPLAILILRVELRHVGMWSLPMEGAGHVPLDGDVQGEAGSATGWEAHASAVLQGMIPLGPTRLLMWDQIGVELVTLGSADRYQSPRHDVALARQDAVVANSAMLLLEVPLGDDLRLRVGAYDEVQLVPSSDALTHQVGGIAALTFERPAPPLVELTPMIRAGVYTDGRRAGEVSVLAGALLEWR